jgi:hypothetical protein
MRLSCWVARAGAYRSRKSPTLIEVADEDVKALYLFALYSAARQEDLSQDAPPHDRQGWVALVPALQDEKEVGNMGAPSDLRAATVQGVDRESRGAVWAARSHSLRRFAPLRAIASG